MPQMLPLYAVLKEKTAKGVSGDENNSCEDADIISQPVCVRSGIALPWRRQKGWPERYMLVFVWTGSAQAIPANPAGSGGYPGRWTHHVVVQTAEEIDRELLDWIHEAYLFFHGKIGKAPGTPRACRPARNGWTEHGSKQ